MSDTAQFLCKLSRFETPSHNTIKYCGVQEVCQQIYATLYDYPCLKGCGGLLDYVTQCVRVAWALAVQRRPFAIQYQATAFHPAFHTRFHTSNPEEKTIASYLWPALVDFDGVCVSKAMVIT